MGTPLFQVDAFTSTPFRGNPAGVCLVSKGANAGRMQDIASEMNVSETAFVRRRVDGDFDLRWFTPTVEVELCGHATLAAAHILWETAAVPAEHVLRFHTKSGLLTARRNGEETELDFPATPPLETAAPPGLLEALGVQAKRVGRTTSDYLIELANERAVRAVGPDFARLRTLHTRGVIVTAHANHPAFDFVSRFFAPAVGVDEDPVTGSAHCALAPYWGELLRKQRLVGYQASSRGGTVYATLNGDRVWLAGHAVTVFRGELSTNAQV